MTLMARGVTVAQQVLILLAQVRILAGQFLQLHRWS